MKKILTIGIPTINNPNGVFNAINSVIKQAKENNYVNDIEIIVSDNSSNTDTFTKIENLLKEYDFIKYSSNKQNIGFDRNINMLLSLSKADFCWTLSDNDEITEDALYEVLNAIRNNPTVNHIIIASKDISLNKLKQYKNMEDAMTSMEYWIPGGLISRNIFRVASIPKDIDKYFDNDWIHLSISMKIDGDSPVMFIKEILVDNDGDCKWAKNGKTLRTYLNLFSIIEGIETPPYNIIFKKKIISILLKGLPSAVLSSKLYGANISYNNINLIYKRLINHKFYMIISIILLLVPTILVEYAKKLKNCCRN